MIKNLNVTTKSRKLSKEFLGGKLYDDGFGNDLLNITPSVHQS